MVFWNEVVFDGTEITWGIRFVSLGTVERYSHAFAGAAICLSGLAIQFLGL